MDSQHQPAPGGAWAAWQRALSAGGSAQAGPGKSRRADVVLTVATYLALVLFGLAQGLLGAFFYSWGPAPLAAVGFAAGILGTCLLGGWGMRHPAGGVAPAVGWFAVVFLLATGTSQGSVLITATTAGEWFLFGGSALVAIGMVLCFARWSGRRRPGS